METTTLSLQAMRLQVTADQGLIDPIPFTDNERQNVALAKSIFQRVGGTLTREIDGFLDTQTNLLPSSDSRQHSSLDLD